LKCLSLFRQSRFTRRSLASCNPRLSRSERYYASDLNIRITYADGTVATGFQKLPPDKEPYPWSKKP
jgi:hypothetical protein